MRAPRRNFLRQGMTPVRQVTIGPMFVGRKPEEIGWESVAHERPPLSPPTRTGWRVCGSGPAGTARSFEIHETVRLNAMATAGGRGCAIP